MVLRFDASQSRGEELALEDLNEKPSEWLCAWFASRGKFKGDAAAFLDINYFEAGLLSSLGVIEFISDIEDRFGVHFSEQDFQDPRFVTVAGVAELISAQISEQISEPRANSLEKPTEQL